MRVKILLLAYLEDFNNEEKRFHEKDSSLFRGEELIRKSNLSNSKYGFNNEENVKEKRCNLYFDKAKGWTK
jgi:hypothetical protein